jgi:hypothetical protein
MRSHQDEKVWLQLLQFTACNTQDLKVQMKHDMLSKYQKVGTRGLVKVERVAYLSKGSDTKSSHLATNNPV